MARRAIPTAEYRRRVEATAAALAFTGDVKSKKERAPSSWDRVQAQALVTHFIETRDWTKARPQHFVELYGRLHLQVYGVEALELRTKKTAMACAALARRCLDRFFDGDSNALADFVRWVWIGQAREEKRRRAGASSRDFRVTWRYQWSDSLVTQYNRAMLTEKAERSG